MVIGSVGVYVISCKVVILDSRHQSICNGKARLIEFTVFYERFCVSRGSKTDPPSIVQ